MTLSAISLCSRALLKIGASAITSFDDGTAESEVAFNLYHSVRDSVLSSHPWSFALSQRELPRLEAQPLADYSYAYKLPNDFIRVLSAGNSSRGRGMNYRVYQDALHTFSDKVVLTYIFRPDESTVPAYFDTALITKLASEFCIPLTENTSRADFLYRRAEEELRRARLVDSQQAPSQAIECFPLIDSRGA